MMDAKLAFMPTRVFLDLEDARKRIGLFIDHYNFHRPHQGLDGLVLADRFFQAAPEVLKTLHDRVAANALELARHGVPKRPFYLTGQVGGKTFSVHAEGERVILVSESESRIGELESEVQRLRISEPLSVSGRPSPFSGLFQSSILI